MGLQPEFTEWFIERAEENLYDIVHANFWISAVVALAAKRRLGVPFVVTFHALGKVRRQFQGTNDWFPPVREEIEAEVIREADQVIAECPEDEEQLIRLYDGTGESDLGRVGSYVRQCRGIGGQCRQLDSAPRRP